MSIIGFGKFSKFYWLIIISAAIKLIISIVYKLPYIYHEQNKTLSNFSLIKEPEINDQIFHLFYILLFRIISFKFNFSFN